MDNLIKKLLTFICITLLTSCSSTIPLTIENQKSLQNRGSFKSVYVSRLIVRDARPSLFLRDFFGSGEHSDFVRYYDQNTPHGYFEIFNNEANYNDKLTNFFRDTPLRIDQLLYDTFVNEWRHRNLIPLTPSLEPDAVIKLELTKYGLLFRSSTLRPYLEVKASIVDANNKIIWQEEAGYGLFVAGPKNNLRLQQWISRPEQLKNAFKNVAQIVSESIIDVIAKDIR